jgi:6-phosphogluconolactonase
MSMVRVLPDAPALARAAARLTAEAARRAAEKRGRFLWVLAGGRTPLPLYRLLAEKTWDHELPWSVTHLFWGDERCLPPDHPDSNQGAALRALGRRAEELAPRLHPMPGGLGPERGAAAYQAELEDFFGPGGPPVMDLILLGLGADGHLASLFAGSPASAEVRAWVAGTDAPPQALPTVPRLTLTWPVINAARRVLVLVSGEDKAPAVAALLRPDQTPPPAWPASRLASRQARWLLDREAARDLPEVSLARLLA